MRNGEQLDIPLIEDEESIYFGRRPLPRYVNHQLDIILNNHVMDPLRKEILKRLKSTLIGKNKISAWYEVFLTIYILLETLESACQNQLYQCASFQDTVSAMRQSLIFITLPDKV